jgi:ribosomal protein L33
MNCLGIRCTNIKYHAMIKEPYKIEIVLEQLDCSDDFVPEVLLNGLSLSCETQKRANTLYFFSFWANYSDVYKVQANENTKLLAWEEHRNFDMYKESNEPEKLENIYYCPAQNKIIKHIAQHRIKL